MKNQNYIALSFDIEDWYHSAAITGESFSLFKNIDEFFREWKERYDYITKSTLKILKLLDYYDISATFFIVADIIKYYPKIVNALINSKHEIGCHGLHHQSPFDYKTKKSTIIKENWQKDVKIAKEKLENTFQRLVIGYRAPNAGFANWMVDPLIELGFKYDSSIAYNSFYNKTNIPLKNIPSFPYKLNRKDLSNICPNTELTELPWSYYRLSNLALPGGGAFFFRLFGYHYFKTMLRQNLSRGHTMFYLHAIDLSDENIPLNNFMNRPFYWTNKGIRTEHKIIKLIECFKHKFKSCYEIYEFSKNEEM